jgi:hypothetical protein
MPHSVAKSGPYKTYWSTRTDFLPTADLLFKWHWKVPAYVDPHTVGRPGLTETHPREQRNIGTR